MKFEQDIRRQLKWVIGQLKCLKDKGCLCFSFEPALEYNETTGELSSTYIDDTTKIVQLNVPRKTSNLTNDGENGTDPFITLDDVPEYTLSPISGSNQVDLLKDGVSVSVIDLTPYLDDTNLARLVSGTLDANTGIATFTRDDSTTFTLDLSNLSNSDADWLKSDGTIADNITDDIYTMGNVGIGTTPDPNTKLDVDGNIRVRQMPNVNADITFTKEIVAKGDGTFGVIDKRKLNRETLIFLGKLTQTGTNAPVVTVEGNINDADLTFLNNRIGTGWYTLFIASSTVDLTDYIIVIFMQDKTFGFLNDAVSDSVKSEMMGTNIIILSLRNGVLTDGTLNNRFSIYLYKK